MGTGTTVDGVKVRDGADPSRIMTVNSDLSINVTPAIGSKWTTQLQAVTTVGVETVISVPNAETQLLAANANRIGGFIQNLDASVLQVYTTTGKAFGAGGMQLRQYEFWYPDQNGAIYRGIVYGRRAAATGDAAACEET